MAMEKSEKKRKDKVKTKFTFNSVKTKLILYFSILILISSLTTGIVGLRASKAAIIRATEESLVSLAYDGAKLTKSNIEKELRTIELISHRKEIQSMDLEIQLPALEDELKWTSFIDMGVVDLEGNAYYTDGSTAKLGDRDYIKQALAGDSSISDIIDSKIIEDKVLMFATPIKSEGKVVGALIGRRHGNALSHIIDNTGFGNRGYGYMINRQGIIVAHPKGEMVLNQFNPLKEAEKDENLKSLASFVERVLNERRGVGKYTYEGDSLYAGYAPIEGTNWVFIFTADEEQSLAAIPNLQKNILKSIIIILLISATITYLIGTSIAKPIIQVAQRSKKLADLDIREEVLDNFLNKKDEMGELGRAFQNIINNLKEIVNEVNGSSQQVSAASQELMATSQETATAAEEVTKVVEEIARGANEQALNTEEGSRKAMELGEAIEKNGDYLKGLNTASEKVIKIIEEGLIQVEKLSEITNESEIAIEEIHKIILKTNESSNEIGDASNVIASIADQTNLLALNAAIEAARAGEAGRGFAVVAEEIRKLAEQSSQSTMTIDEIVSELQDNSQNAVKAMERVSAITKEQIESVESNKDKYMGIDDAIKYVFNITEKLNESGEKMEEMKDEILDTLQNLTAIAEENSAATEEASASMEELTASTEEISGSSGGLADLAQNLQGLINRFKV